MALEDSPSRRTFIDSKAKNVALWISTGLFTSVFVRQVVPHREKTSEKVSAAKVGSVVGGAVGTFAALEAALPELTASTTPYSRRDIGAHALKLFGIATLAGIASPAETDVAREGYNMLGGTEAVRNVVVWTASPPER